LWDLAFFREIAHFPGGESRSALFHPDGGSLFTRTNLGLDRWRMKPGPEMPTEGISISPPQRLLDLTPSNGGYRAPFDQDGRTIAVSNRGVGQLVLVDLDGGAENVVISGHPNIDQIAVAPDGRWVAAATHFQLPSDLVRIIDTRDNKVTTTLAVARANPT